MVSLAFHSSSHNGVAPRHRRPVLARVTAAFAALVKEWHIRQTVRLIEAMDDRMLSDLGIAPGRIEDAVRFGR